MTALTAMVRSLRTRILTLCAFVAAVLCAASVQPAQASSVISLGTSSGSWWGMTNYFSTSAGTLSLVGTSSALVLGTTGPATQTTVLDSLGGIVPQSQSFIAAPALTIATLPQSYAITSTASPVSGGATRGGGTWEDGTWVSLVASPTDGSTFVNWTENGAVVSTKKNVPR